MMRQRGQRGQRTQRLAAVAALLLTCACRPSVPPPLRLGGSPARTPAISPAPAPGPARQLGGPGSGVLSHGSRLRPLVALTFDSNLTAYMIRELNRGTIRSFDNTTEIRELIHLHVPATFFLSGLWMQRYPQTTRQLAAVPFFELGSHSFSHRGFAPHCYDLGVLPESAMVSDINASERTLARYDSHPTRLFRFPGGCYTTAALQAAARAGVEVVQYDVASGDAFGQSVNRIVRHTLSSVRNGSIVVMHITGGDTAPLSAPALPLIVRGLRARGFRLVTVSQLLAR